MVIAECLVARSPLPTSRLLATLECWLQSPAGAARCHAGGWVPICTVANECADLHFLADDTIISSMELTRSFPPEGPIEYDSKDNTVRLRGLLARVRAAAEEHVLSVGSSSLCTLLEASQISVVFGGITKNGERMQVLRDALRDSNILEVRGVWAVLRAEGECLALAWCTAQHSSVAQRAGGANTWAGKPLSPDAPIFVPLQHQVCAADITGPRRYTSKPLPPNLTDTGEAGHAEFNACVANAGPGVARKEAPSGKASSLDLPCRCARSEADSEPDAEVSPRMGAIVEPRSLVPLADGPDARTDTFKAERALQAQVVAGRTCQGEAENHLDAHRSLQGEACEDDTEGRLVADEHRCTAQAGAKRAPAVPRGGVGKMTRSPPAPRDRNEADGFHCAHSQSEVPETGFRGGQVRVAPTSWMAQRCQHRTSEGPGDGSATPESDGQLARAIRSILNKLTVEKFERLSGKLVKCSIETTGHIDLLLREILDKAAAQHHFVDMYADLCFFLDEFYTEHPIAGNSSLFFRRALRAHCRTTFERLSTPPSGLEGLDAEERSAAEGQYKRRMLGHIRFTGALLVRGLLPAKLLLALLELLFGEATPEAVEAVAALLTVAGPAFDAPSSSLRPTLEEHFARARAIVASSCCAPRSRCLLQDVLDLRASSWRSCRPACQERPSARRAAAERAGGTEAASRRQPQAAAATQRAGAAEAPSRRHPRAAALAVPASAHGSPLQASAGAPTRGCEPCAPKHLPARTAWDFQ